MRQSKGWEDNSSSQPFKWDEQDNCSVRAESLSEYSRQEEKCTFHCSPNPFLSNACQRVTWLLKFATRGNRPEIRKQLLSLWVLVTVTWILSFAQDQIVLRWTLNINYIQYILQILLLQVEMVTLTSVTHGTITLSVILRPLAQKMYGEKKRRLVVLISSTPIVRLQNSRAKASRVILATTQQGSHKWQQ